jgi:hypothetical protein
MKYGLPAPCLLLPVPYSLLLIPYALFPIAQGAIQNSKSQIQDYSEAEFRIQNSISDSKLLKS